MNDRRYADSFLGAWLIGLFFSFMLAISVFLLLIKFTPLWPALVVTIAVVIFLALLPWVAHFFYCNSDWHSEHEGLTLTFYVGTALMAMAAAAFVGVLVLVACWWFGKPYLLAGLAALPTMAFAHSRLFTANLSNSHTYLTPGGTDTPRSSGLGIEDLDRFSYRTADGGFEFEFLIRRRSGAWRICLLKSPHYWLYRREAIGHAPHRLYDAALDEYYVCFTPPAGSTLAKVREAAMTFAELTERYLYTGQSW